MYLEGELERGIVPLESAWMHGRGCGEDACLLMLQKMNLEVLQKWAHARTCTVHTRPQNGRSSMLTWNDVTDLSWHVTRVQPLVTEHPSGVCVGTACKGRSMRSWTENSSSAWQGGST